ncbi:MAG: hypothetical protein M1467_05840 [Deltaproteobacteria bacterium]|nr:hypothetical protein [Deltaproteobacteria bacterium]
MSDILKYGQGILFMKVGTHADEPLEEIIARKIREIDSAGYAMWGYGGNTCHPTSIVQPFARDYTIGKNNIYLCMQSMESKHFAAPKRAEKYSIDGVKWEDIPKGVNVLGSRYALVIKNLSMDTGESILCAIAINRTNKCLTYIVTGDKRAIQSISQIIPFIKKINYLNGKFICLEQIILGLIRNGNLIKIRKNICCAHNLDKTLS